MGIVYDAKSETSSDAPIVGYCDHAWNEQTFADHRVYGQSSFHQVHPKCVDKMLVISVLKFVTTLCVT